MWAAPLLGARAEPQRVCVSRGDEVRPVHDHAGRGAARYRQAGEGRGGAQRNHLDPVRGLLAVVPCRVVVAHVEVSGTTRECLLQYFS